MSEQVFPSKSYPADVHVLSYRDKTILLVGTAHISRRSVELVTEVISTEQPDTVCLELDDKRFQALADGKRWQRLDLRAVIRKRQLSTLLVSLMMASYQKRLGENLGVAPGAELLAAAETAKQHGIPVRLCDRDIRITLRRAWKSTSLWRKSYLLAALIAGLFESEKIDEKHLEELKNQDVLTELMADMGDSLPAMKRVLIDERDIYLAEKIKEAPGSTIVAVVGAGHVDGIKRCFGLDQQQLLSDITTIPPVSPGWKVAGWLIPLIIIGSIAFIGMRQGADVAGANMVYWILANGIPAAVGSLLAFAHPLTIVSAFASAPFTSLTPVIGAGYVTAFVQVMVCPPVVSEFEAVADDLSSIPKWWSNKLLRVFLVFILTGIGSFIGTYIGGYEIVTNLIKS